jgi:hypothetical protein
MLEGEQCQFIDERVALLSSIAPLPNILMPEHVAVEQ